MIRYSNFLSPEEFNKLAVLMKDLAPTLVILVRPQNAAGIKAGHWESVRKNLMIVLEGDDRASPLFD